MTVSFEIPGEVERTLKDTGIDASRVALEAFLVELYRRRQISLGRLAETLGLSRYEADGLLKRHGVYPEITPEEYETELASLRDLG
jgi:predicted HTH domain antitoxin